jgi:MFS transporter, DHA2 family, multidrug resistance protein
MAAAQALPSPSSLSERKKLLIFGIMAFGQFMALLDVQIVAASLNSIQAGLTAYLMAEIVMIPLSGFLSQALSTRWLFTLSAALFTIFSLACGLAWDMPSMIMFRTIQGFVGGAMVPTVFSAGFSMFTGKRQAMIPLVLGLVSTLAPALGPTIGGWVSDTVSWRWLFFMNVIPGLGITIALPILGKIDTAQPSMLKRIDWLHVASLALFLGAMQYALEEGPRYQWFEDENVSIATMLSAIGFVVFLERSFYSTMPVVKLTAFRKPTFAMACAFNMVIGVGIYGSTYLMPVFLARVRDFSSFEIGTTVFVTGLFMASSAPIAATLSNLIDPRYVISVGLVLFASGLWLLSYITPDWGFSQLFLPQAVRGFAILLCIVPTVGMALRGLSGPELRYGSGLFNLMRNLGGAIGIALVDTWLQDGGRWHAARLGEALGARPGHAPTVMSNLAGHMSTVTPDPSHAMQMTRGLIGRLAAQQSLTQSFQDVFALMACLFLAALVMVPFFRAAPVVEGVEAPAAH